jgi:catechol 2,3-dioxygenase-like lactoylglutathione lyase family enzyme
MTHDIDGAIAFYEGTLGFNCTFRMENYAFLRRKGGALRLIAVAADCDIGEQMIYLDCEDPDGVYTQMKPQLDLLPADRVRAPFDQPYGMREFHVKGPDNFLLLFGADIPPSP